MWFNQVLMDDDGEETMADEKRQPSTDHRNALPALLSGAFPTALSLAISQSNLPESSAAKFISGLGKIARRFRATIRRGAHLSSAEIVRATCVYSSAHFWDPLCVPPVFRMVRVELDTLS